MGSSKDGISAKDEGVWMKRPVFSPPLLKRGDLVVSLFPPFLSLTSSPVEKQPVGGRYL